MSASDFVIDKVFPVFGWTIGIGIALIILAGIAWLVCIPFSRSWETTGLVIGRGHEESTLRTGVGPVVGGSGGVAITTSGHGEKWETLIEVDGRVYVFDDVTVYAQADAGDTLRVEMTSHPMSGPSISSVWTERRAK